MLALVKRGLPGMSPKTDWLCWKVTKCDNTDSCPARQQEEVPCWELAKKLEDYRTVLNVCQDCIVYLSNHKNSILTEEEINAIMEKKGVCVLASKCTHYSPVDKS